MPAPSPAAAKAGVRAPPKPMRVRSGTGLLKSRIGQSRATEVLQRKRALTLPMIRKIAAAWHVPERVLVKDYELQRGKGAAAA